MNTLILNRETFTLPADHWYQIAPLGEFPHSPSGTVQVIDAFACTSMGNRFNEESRVENFAGLLIDFDHFSLDQGSKSEAAGWIVGLEYRGDENGREKAQKAQSAGLWAKIRWSDLGEEAVKGGRYRFLSPVWTRADCEDLGDGRVRPVRLLNAAVTNDPNLKGMVPLSNRGVGVCESGSVGVVANAAEDQRYRWTLSSGENVRHCPSCSGLAGQVHTLAEWEASGVMPGSGALYCGANCNCSLVMTDEPVDGDLDDVPQSFVGPPGPDGDVENRRTREWLIWAKGELRNRRSVDFIAGVESGAVPGERAGRTRTLERLMSKAQATGKEAEGKAAGEQDIATLTNALRLEREKNEVLLNEVVTLEDELVNRQLADFEGVISDETREFWREQLISNRDGALGALKELASLKAEGGKLKAEGGESSTRRPLHNRQTARPVPPGHGGEAGRRGEADNTAVKIRNRAHELVKAERIPFSTAFRRAEREVCESVGA